MGLFRRYRRIFSATVTLIAVAAGSTISQGSVLAKPSDFEFYDVQDGDTWAKIAAAFGTPLNSIYSANGVVNPSRLATGQRLYIPTNYHGQSTLPLQIVTGNSLWNAALSGDTLISAVAFVNNATPSQTEALVYAFQPGTVGLASAQGPTNPTPLPTQQPGQQPGLQLPTYSPPQESQDIAPGPPLTRARLGVQGYFQLEPDKIDSWLNMAQSAGFSWVKYQVNWKENESPQGQYPNLPTLDAFFDLAERRSLNVLLSIAKAPDWARSTTDGDGPPTDYNTLNAFVGFLANHYRSRLDHIQVAIEIWNEPNTSREWNGTPISAQNYVTMLAGASNAIKAQDPRYFVITAGLAPTGVNDGVVAREDRQYLSDMLQAGAAQYADAIGIHPYGWANPPGVRCCNSTLGPPTYNDNPRFFFLNTIDDYRAIEAKYGVSAKPLWATEFGWGTADHIGTPPQNAAYFANTSSVQQAQYIVDAYRWAQDQDYMGPMFLWNLNMAAYFLSDPDQSAYSIMFGLDSPQQAYTLIRNTQKK